LRRLNDIAFSGDGEPTTHRNFDEIIAACAESNAARLDDVKMVLITNASRSIVRTCSALGNPGSQQGEIWAKLDAGTEAYFQRVDRSPVRSAASWKTSRRPLAFAVGHPVAVDEDRRPVASRRRDSAFCQRLCEITAAGGRLSLIQIYTIARRPARLCRALSDDQVARIADVVVAIQVAVAAFYGVGSRNTPFVRVLTSLEFTL